MNIKSSSKMSLMTLAILFLCATALIHQVMSGYRFDMTEGKLYTLSEGTRQIISKIDEPITLKFYYSKSLMTHYPQLQTYAERVEELLKEYVRHADNKIILDIVDPEPFSPEEDEATAYGLQAVPVDGQTEEAIFFGLVGLNSIDVIEALPFFQPDKEMLLEYDVSKLIYNLTTFKKPILGILSGLPVEGMFDPSTQQAYAPWIFYEQLEPLFDTVHLRLDAKKIPEEIDTLLLIHPKNITEAMLIAIDQFVMRSGKLLLFVDPYAEMSNASSPGTVSESISRVEPLLTRWGVYIDHKKILLDGKRALSVRMGDEQSIVRHLAMIGLLPEDINQSEVITNGLSSVNLSTTAVIEPLENTSTIMTPLLQSSTATDLVNTQRLPFLPDPSHLLDDFNANNTVYTLGAKISGPAKSAYTKQQVGESFKAGNDNIQIILVADTDVLSDRLWAQAQHFFGEKIYTAFANNGDFVLNAIESLMGSNALISIRSRMRHSRPFSAVEHLKVKAETEFRTKERELQQKLAETERKLEALQNQRISNGILQLTPEQERTINEFIQEKIKIRQALREVSHGLNKEINQLGELIKLVNILFMPLLVILFYLGYSLYRKRHIRNRVSH